MEPTTANLEANAPKRDPQNGDFAADQAQEPPSKRARLDDAAGPNGQAADALAPRVKGVAPIKAEYVTNTDLATPALSN